MENIKKYLQGGDLRSTGRVDQLVPLIKNQKDFDALFAYLSSDYRLIAMRAADAADKVTKVYPEYLKRHKKELLHLFENAQHKEFKWHVTLLVARLNLSQREQEWVWAVLEQWTCDKSESRIVRVNALQGLYELSQKNSCFANDFAHTVAELKKENVPSLHARMRQLGI